MEGTFAIAALHLDHPGQNFRDPSRLTPAPCQDRGPWCVSSDQISVAPIADEIVVLEDGDLAVISGDGPKITDIEGRPVERPRMPVEREAAEITKAGFETFMEKEIREQPAVLARAIAADFDIELIPPGSAAS